MPVDYGILKPIQQTLSPVMGSAPSASAPAVRAEQDPLADFSKGFLSSYQQGQSIQNNDEIIKQNQMQTKQMEQKMSDSAILRDAAQKDDAAYKQALIQTGNPEAAVDYDVKLQGRREANARANIAEKSDYKALLEIQQDFYGSVSMAMDPKTGKMDPQQAQTIWQLRRNAMPDAAKKYVPEQFDQNNYMAGMSALRHAYAEYKEKHPETNTSASGLGKIQDDINKKQEAINTKKAQGIDTSSDEAQLGQLQQGADKAATPTKMVQSPGQQVTAAVTTDELKKSSEEAATARNINNKLSALETLDKSDEVKEGSLAGLAVSGKKGVSALGQMFGVDVDPKTSSSEAFNAIAKDLQLDYQAKLKGSSSDRDMALVGEAVPQLTNTKAGRELMYNWGKANNTAIVQRNDFMKEWAAGHDGSLVGSNESWDTFINSDARLDPKTKKFDTEKYNRKYWKPYLDEGYAGQQSMKSPRAADTPAYSQEDLEHTAKKHNMTVEQVKAKLAGGK